MKKDIKQIKAEKKAIRKEIALELLAPYIKDPSTCGMNGMTCVYLSDQGNMCVAGKCMTNPSHWNDEGTIETILTINTQRKVFKPEYVGVFTDRQWSFLQDIHDSIPNGNNNVNLELRMSELCKELGLFTYYELKERANNL